MKIAVTYDNGEIGQHFGHTEQFKVYVIEDGEIKSSTLIGTGDAGHCALGGFLGQQGIDALICGGIGGGAVNALKAAGISLYGGVSGDPDAAVEALLNNELTFYAKANCNSHGHGDSGHSCHH